MISSSFETDPERKGNVDSDFSLNYSYSAFSTFTNTHLIKRNLSSNSYSCYKNVMFLSFIYFSLQQIFPLGQIHHIQSSIQVLKHFVIFLIIEMWIDCLQKNMFSPEKHIPVGGTFWNGMVTYGKYTIWEQFRLVPLRGYQLTFQ